MARVELEDRWQTNLAADAVGQVIEQFFAGNNVKVAQRQPGELAGKQGSGFKTRLIGGWMADPAVFPKRIAVRYQPRDAGCEVQVRMEESMGFGFMDAHFKSRYANYFAELMGRLKQAIPPSGGADEVVDATVVPE